MFEAVVTSTDIVAAAVAAALWWGLYGVVRRCARPACPVAAPATLDLGDEPPAVVNLVANCWRLTADAVPATLLDLAARGYVELGQSGADVSGTTIRARARAERAGVLAAHERRLLDRVHALAGTAWTPVPALAFRSRRQAWLWHRAFRVEVVAEARRRGLSRRRFGVAALLVLSAGALLAGVVMAVGAASRGAPASMAILDAVGLALVMAWLGLRYPGERHTAAGRATAAHWLGVGEGLRRQGSLAYQPPTAVGHWGRYLPYAAALGVARVAGPVLDPGTGRLRVVWCGYGGRWRRVRVRIPWGWPRYGCTPVRMVWRSVLRLAGGPVLIFVGVQLGADGRVLADLGPVVVLAGVLMVLLGSYTLIRASIDLAVPVWVRGEVLWLSDSRYGEAGAELAKLAVDEGVGDRTVAWLVPARLAGGVRDGDVVRMSAYRWTRWVRRVEVVARRQRPDEPPVDEFDPDVVMAALGGDRVAGAAVRAAGWIERAGRLLGGELRLPDVRTLRIADLLTAGEVSDAVGVAVDGPEPWGPHFCFRIRGGGRRVLVIAGYVGGATRRLARLLPGRRLSGVGDDARLRRVGGWVRVDQTVVLLTLTAEGRAANPDVPRLLSRVAARLDFGH